jgi:iron complex outermembrane receptor protein
VSTLKDALEFAPGVLVQPRFGAEEARLSIRGSGLQRTFHGRGLKLLQDGVPLNLADGGFDFQAVEPLAARYVEVFRGPNGLDLGASTLGGAINFVSRTGHDAEGAEVRVEGGSFGYLRAQAATGGAAGRADWFVGLHQFGQDGFRDHARQDTQRFFGNLGWRGAADRETRIYLTAVRTDSELPGSLTRAQLAADPSQAAAGNLALDQKRDFDLFRLASRTALRFGSDAGLEIGAFWAYKHLDHPIFQVIDQFSHDFGADLRYQNERDWGGRRNRLVVGLAPTYGRLDDERFRNVAGERGARTARGETASLNVDLYAEDRLEVRPRLTLVAGVVASRAERDFDDLFLADGDQTDRRRFDGFSPKLGLLWEARPEVVLFANASRSFEPPSFGELTNVGGDGLAPVDEQTADTLEVGVRGQAGRARWDAVLYSARVEGELLSLNDGAGNPLGTINADRTRHDGAEVGFDLVVAESPGLGSLRFRQAYTWSRFTFDGDPTYGDNALAGLPEHSLRAELAWEHPSGFYGGPQLEWVPDGYPVDQANTLFADSYTLVGMRGGYRAKSGWGVFVDGRNLTDETYAATTGVIADARGRDSAQFLPGDGRSVYAGLEVRR